MIIRKTPKPRKIIPEILNMWSSIEKFLDLIFLNFYP